MTEPKTAEKKRLEENLQRKVYWTRWGPYLSERQWGTVREDYSPDGEAWEYFPHDHARSRTYRWGEDGIAGICDRHQYICFSVAVWNGRDPILKERLFGLDNEQGNHGEDVKEYYFYLDSTPTHSYMKYLYKYPQSEFPYKRLIHENHRRGRDKYEFELMDTGVFDENKYFDVFVEYAKANAEDILIRISVYNRGPETATLDLLPTVWLRNTWSWGIDDRRPTMKKADGIKDAAVISLEHYHYGQRWLVCQDNPELLFTENETNTQTLYGTPNQSPYVKDGINEYVVNHNTAAVNPRNNGTKAAARYRVQVEAGGNRVIHLRFTNQSPRNGVLSEGFDDIFTKRRQEADEFYAERLPEGGSDDGRNIQRQAFAGLLWNKQFYNYDVKTWLAGDPTMPTPPPERLTGRNHEWFHLYNDDIVSMPDKWEYPWYAAWDLAFHCVTLALIDPEFAKSQLVLFLREWYMHPSGQIPAYEWNFGDVNPPVHAWAAWRVYKIEQRITGTADRAFLERVFQKLLLNFTWWVNRKDVEGFNVFQGGFLGLDNIGVFDRSRPLPTGGYIEQSDGTSWMAMYCLNMLAIALELAREDRVYGDVASKFFEHFVYISAAMNNMGHEGLELWDEDDGFYYDVLHMPAGEHRQLKIRSMVGLIPLFGVEALEPELIEELPGFKKRMQWFIENRPELRGNIFDMARPDGKMRRLLCIVSPDRLRRVLNYLLDEEEFLSPHGVRALSRYHHDHPFIFETSNQEYRVDYEPAESTTFLFGGNSNWRGPIWFPMNFLLIESLQKYDFFLGDQFRAECPTGSGKSMSLWDISKELSVRLTRIFLRGDDGNRPVYGGLDKFQHDPFWRDLIQFHEYFHGDNGAGLGASHQTGWTALVAKLIEQSGGSPPD